jgi:hypothetical protein
MLINNVEDFADPPTLGTVERAFRKIEHGTYVLTPYRRFLHRGTPLPYQSARKSGETSSAQVISCLARPTYNAGQRSRE